MLAKQQAQAQEQKDMRRRCDGMNQSRQEIANAFNRRVGLRRDGKGKTAKARQQCPPAERRLNPCPIHRRLNRNPKPTKAIMEPPARTMIRPHGQRTSRPRAMPAR